MGLLVICGAAKCLWNDLARLPDNLNADWMAVNVAGVFVPHPVKYLVSLHETHVNEYRMQRRALGYPGEAITIANGGSPDKVIEFSGERGGSGLYAIRCGLKLGYDKIVLAGMPIDSSRYFFDMPRMESLLPASIRMDGVRADAFQRSWVGCVYAKTWKSVSEELKPNVRSMSGYTARLFGEPNDLWLGVN